jgi:hypothetical protein
MRERHFVERRKVVRASEAEDRRVSLAIDRQRRGLVRTAASEVRRNTSEPSPDASGLILATKAS